MQIYWNKRKHLHKKRVQLPQDWFGTPTWPPWRHVETLYCFRRSRCRRLRRCVSSLLFWKPASHPSTPPPPKLISGSGWTGPQLAWWIPYYKLSLEKMTSPTNRHVFDTTLSFKCKSTIRVILVIFRFWRNINLHNFFSKEDNSTSVCLLTNGFQVNGELRQEPAEKGRGENGNWKS